MVVPLDERAHSPEAADRVPVERPDRVGHRRVVRVQQVRPEVLVTRQMELRHPLHRDAAEVLRRVESVVARAHVHVVHVQQEQAVRAPRDLGQELPFGDPGGGVGEVAGDILQHDAPPEPLLHLGNPAHHVGQRLLGEGHGQEVVRVVPPEGAPAEVVRDPGRLHRLRERPDVIEVLDVQRVHRADGQGYAVEHQRPVPAHGLQNRPGTSTDVQEVLGDDLEPVGPPALLEQVGEVLGAQADAVAEEGNHCPEVRKAHRSRGRAVGKRAPAPVW